MTTSKTDERGPRAPSKKPCRFFHLNDCYRGDKCHMVHVAKDTLAPCQVHLFWMEDPWTRPACEWGELCTFPHPKAKGPEEPELLRTNVALQTENSQLARVREYAANVLGKGGAASDTGVARSGTSRYNQKLALLEARDPKEFSRRCVADPSLCRSLLRVYLLGGGVCRSLEETGKAASDAVAAGKYPVRGSPAAAGEDAAAAAGGVAPPAGDVPVPAPGGGGGGEPTPPPPQLCVRVQALPKVMEMQLIDEDSTFWEDNFPNLVRERQSGAFTHVLSVIFCRGAFLWGLAEAATHGRSIIDNNNEDSAVCRAFYKIKEVTSRAELSYGKDWTAIDIGAAPGGWTSFLASKCRRVLSVDPAELDPAVLALTNVVHIQSLVQNAIGELLGLLAEAPSQTGTTASPHPTQNGGDSGGGEGEGEGEGGGGDKGDGVKCSGDSDAVSSPSPSPRASSAGTAGCAGGVAQGQRRGGAQLVVSDMNAEPSVVAGVILSAMAAGLVRPGAVVVATFKDFCGRHKKMRDEVALALARLKAGTAAGEGDGDGGGDCDGGVVGGVTGESTDAVAVAGPGPAGGGQETAATAAPPTTTAAPEISNPQCDPADGAGAGAGAGAAEGGGVTSLGKHACAVTTGAAERGDGVNGAGNDAKTAAAGAGGWWKLEGVETMKLLSGGRAEVTFVARATCEV